MSSNLQPLTFFQHSGGGQGTLDLRQDIIQLRAFDRLTGNHQHPARFEPWIESPPTFAEESPGTIAFHRLKIEATGNQKRHPACAVGRRLQNQNHRKPPRLARTLLNCLNLTAIAQSSAYPERGVRRGFQQSGSGGDGHRSGRGLHCQAGTADLAAMGQNLAAVGSGHAVTETVGALAGLVMWLKSTFHGRYFLYLMW